MVPKRTYIDAIWMRLPQVSSKTAVVTGPMLRGRLHEADTEPAQPIELGLHVIDAEGRVRHAVLDERLLEGSRGGVRIGLQEELDAIGRIGRDDGQPPRPAGGNVGLLHEAEHIGIEGECLCLVVDQDAR